MNGFRPSLRARRVAAVLVALVVGILFSRATRVAAAADSPTGTWVVAWDVMGNGFRPALHGDLILRDGRLRFKAYDGRGGWAIELRALKQIVSSELVVWGAHAIEIESRAGERMYIVLLNRHLATTEPTKLVKTLAKAIQINTQRSAMVLAQRGVTQ